MARSNNIAIRVVLPIVVFASLSAVAYKQLFSNLGEAGTVNLQEYCPVPYQGKEPVQKHYLGGYAPKLENILCILTAFFYHLFQPEAAAFTPFIKYFLVSFTSCVAITFFEASRKNRPLVLAVPMLMGCVYQMFSAAVTFPIFWAVFLAFRRDAPVDSLIDQAEAEANLVGLLIGYCLPSFAMTFISDVSSIATWQLFPIFVALIKSFYLLIRPGSPNRSGYQTVRATYILIFITSGLSHLLTLYYYKFDIQNFLAHFLPAFEAPSYAKGHTAVDGTVHFLQWDAIFTFVSSYLASVWMAGSVTRSIKVFLWAIASTVLLGPGAAISGVFLWREAKLNKARSPARSNMKKVQ